MNTLMSPRAVPTASGRHYQDGPAARDQLHKLEAESSDEEAEESHEQREKVAVPPTLSDSASNGPEDDDGDEDDDDGGDEAGWGPDEPGD